jgi:hypothetical protein
MSLNLNYQCTRLVYLNHRSHLIQLNQLTIVYFEYYIEQIFLFDSFTAFLHSRHFDQCEHKMYFDLHLYLHIQAFPKSNEFFDYDQALMIDEFLLTKFALELIPLFKILLKAIQIIQ